MPNLNPARMSAPEVARLLNSTRFGFVLPQNRVYRDFSRAGFRIAAADDPRSIHLVRYIAYLVDRHNAPDPESGARSYEERREAERQRQAEQSAAGRDIGELPEVEDPDRKEKCRTDFRAFCECYFPEVFTLEWSEDHLKVIKKIETAVLKGGLFALAMSRGSGKSSLTEAACLWAMLYGHRPFVVLIGATEGAALEMLDSIKTELEVNEHIAADFPEATFPIAALDGIANRCAGQLYHGVRTRITWTADEIVLPTIEGAASSGVAVRVAGITGRIRGMKFKKPDGRTIRPSLVIVDDPQTTESAGSLEQTRKRVRVLAGDILGLAGPGKKIAGVMPCTVIRPGDMADEILDKVKHPEWQGERMKLVYKFPTNEKLWEQYADLRAEQLRKDGTFTKATAFYKKNRAAMDAGAVVGWPARFNYDEISAVQNAMNLKLQDEVAFWSEYQNEPLPEDLGTEEQLTVDAVIHKLNGHARQALPATCNRLTMFIDVQKALLFYVVCAWDDDFTGYVVDYGAWPDQRRRYFSLADANPTLQSTCPHAGLEGQLYAGLEKLTDAMLGREWLRRDGTPLKIERCLIDANWGDSTEVVYQFCRQTKWANIVLPSHGRYVGASSKPMSEYKKVAGDRVGFNWRIPTVAGRRAIRHVVFDTNFWKSFVQKRLQTAMGDRGCLSLWGREPERHLLYAEHMTAEYKVRTEGRGRVVDEWKMRPEARDNHWWDGTVGCAVAASMCGCVLPGTDNLRPKKDAKPRLKLSDIRKNKR